MRVHKDNLSFPAQGLQHRLRPLCSNALMPLHLEDGIKGIQFRSEIHGVILQKR